MKLEELNFSYDSTKLGMINNRYVYRAASDAMGFTMAYLYDGKRKELGDRMRMHLEAAADTDAFTNAVISDPALIGTVLRSVLIVHERPDLLRDELVRMFASASTVFAATSDAGSVRVGSDLFSVLINNGYGDGEVFCAIFKNGDPFDSILMGETVASQVKGRANIYDCDCAGGEVAATLDGNYLVFVNKGFVAFKEI